MATPCEKPWQQFTTLYDWGLGDIGAMAGQHSCFCLDIMGDVVDLGTLCLVKATISRRAQLICAGQNGMDMFCPSEDDEPQKVLIRATKKDYDMVLRHCRHVKLIQAFVQVQDNQVILDAVCSPSFFAGWKEVRADEVAQVAEIFSGGFAGWSRATAVLRRMGMQVSTKWCLERDDACVPQIQHAESDIRVCHGPNDHDVTGNPGETFLFVTDFNSQWWRPLAAQLHTQVYCISAPCQPWSRAGNQAGMASPDGLILLQVVDYLKAVSAAVAIFEEVDRFPKHHHFQQFCDAMRQAGFVCVWRASVQLAEVSPSYRCRFFMVWIHHSCQHLAQRFQDSRWVARGFPSLQAADTIFASLPQPLLEPCLLSPEVLNMYLNPALLPPSRTGRRNLSPEEVRIVKPSQQAGTFMAQYHFLQRHYGLFTAVSSRCPLCVEP